MPGPIWRWNRFAIHAGGDPNIWTIIGGVIGAIAAAMLMDWAIIILSSLAGAAAILTPFQAKLDEKMLPIAFLVLAVVGIVFQGRRMAGRPPLPPPAETRHRRKTRHAFSKCSC